MCRQSASACLIKLPSRQHRALAGLPQPLATLTDPRHQRGKRHPFVSVLLIVCSAVLTGAPSFAAIGHWARSAPEEALARLGARTTSVFHVRIAPSAATIRRVLNAACPGGLADLLAADPAGAQTLAMDSKSVRGSRHGIIDALAEASLKCWADRAYQGAGGTIRVPFRGRRLKRWKRRHNTSHAKIRCVGERAMATLKGWRLLRKLPWSTNRITDTVKAVFVLHHASK